MGLSCRMEQSLSVKTVDAALDAFATASPTRVFWKSRKRSASVVNLDKVTEEFSADKTTNKRHESPMEVKMQDSTAPILSERRKSLFQPLEPTKNINGKRPSAETLLPPPDFDPASYPKSWLVGKKRKLVNVDVVESMRRIAIQEMNRKDREIDGLNEQLEEDARCLEHLQLQLLQERSMRSDVERERKLLQDQISMLMNMLQENEENEEHEENKECSEYE